MDILKLYIVYILWIIFMDDGTPTTQMRFSDSGGIYRRIEYGM